MIFGSVELLPVTLAVRIDQKPVRGLGHYAGPSTLCQAMARVGSDRLRLLEYTVSLDTALGHREKGGGGNIEVLLFVEPANIGRVRQT